MISKSDLQLLTPVLMATKGGINGAVLGASLGASSYDIFVYGITRP